MCLAGQTTRLRLAPHMTVTLYIESLHSDEYRSRKRKQAGAVPPRLGEGNQSEETSGIGQREEEVGDGDSKRMRETLESRIQSDPTSQHYLEWKENTLRLAREKLLVSEP